VAALLAYIIYVCVWDWAVQLTVAVCANISQRMFERLTKCECCARDLNKSY
jgi:hypothetical protein